MVYVVGTNEAMTKESQRYNCFITYGGNAISEHACSEVNDRNPTPGLTPLWLRNPFRGNSNYSRTPLIRTMVIRISNYPDRLVPSGKFVENST